MPTNTTPAMPTIIIDPNRGYREWHIREIYDPGNPNSGQYVPNKDDAVRDWTQGILRVIDVDYTTGISRLQRWEEPANSNEDIYEDILIGSGPGYQSESFRAFLDTSVFPHTLSLDSRLHFKGTTVTSVKIFLGYDVSERGTVISALYDTAGNLLGENIPVEPVATYDLEVTLPGEASNVVNLAVKAPRVAHTTFRIPDNEVLSVVAYDIQGEPRSKTTVLVKNTSFVRRIDDSLKYVRSIHVETPFLLPTDDKTIEYPINMPVQGLNLFGVATFSDGSTVRLPVDGTKFQMAGLSNYVATIQGQSVPLMLTYQLNANESSYLLPAGPNRRIAVPYFARTRENDGAYSVKIFVIPVWDGLLNGYKLEFLLYNLNRQAVYDVTHLVTFASNSAVYDPLSYNVRQRLVFGVNMQEVDPQFAAWRHTQIVELTLIRAGNWGGVGDAWRVSYTPGQAPEYGEDVKARCEFVNTNLYRYDISTGAATLAEWLSKVYEPLKPLYDSRAESAPPAPNFFVLVAGGSRTEFPIENWNQVLTVTGGEAEGHPTCVEFIRKTANNDLQLAVAGMFTRRVQSL